MIWAGRLNAIFIIGCVIFVGLFWLISLIDKGNPIAAVGVMGTVALAVAIRLGCGVIDLVWRATKGLPFIYQTVVEGDKDRAKIS